MFLDVVTAVAYVFMCICFCYFTYGLVKIWARKELKDLRVYVDNLIHSNHSLLKKMSDSHRLQMECKKMDFNRYFEHQKRLKIEVDLLKSQVFWLLNNTVKKPGVEIEDAKVSEVKKDLNA